MGEAEKAVAENHPDAATVRIPLLYGPVEYLKESAVTQILEQIQQTHNGQFDNYQERWPTSTSDLARVFEYFAAAYLAHGKDEPQSFRGIFHWQGPQMYTKYTMAMEIAEICGIN